jgi:large subunit ribosomal protein L10
MNRDQKAVAIAEIATDIEQSQAVFAVDYRGLSVAQAAELRAKLRDADATLRVVKNSLTERAADQTGTGELKPLLQGPTALTFVRGDAALAAKAIADYARLTQLLPFKGGLMDGAALDADQLRAISRLPSREVLYGQLVGVVASPITGLVRTLGALVGGLAVALGQVREKKESGELPAGEAPASAVEDAPTEEASAEAPAPAGEETPEGGAAEAPAPAAEETPEEASVPAVEETSEEASAEAPAPENQTEPATEPTTDDNQADASAEAETAEANPKED